MYDEHSRRGGGRHSGGGRGRNRGTPLAELDPALTDVSRRLIGCAIEVHKSLGPGFSQEVYAKALEVEMKAEGLAYEPAKPISVFHRDQEVGTRTADLVIEGRFIVELLARRGEIGGTERAALRALLRAADMELGLIINFAERRLKDGLVRVLNPDKLNAMREEQEDHEEDEYEDDDELEDDEEYEDDEEEDEEDES